MVPAGLSGTMREEAIEQRVVHSGVIALARCPCSIHGHRVGRARRGSKGAPLPASTLSAGFFAAVAEFIRAVSVLSLNKNNESSRR